MKAEPKVLKPNQAIKPVQPAKQPVKEIIVVKNEPAAAQGRPGQVVKGKAEPDVSQGRPGQAGKAKEKVLLADKKAAKSKEREKLKEGDLIRSEATCWKVMRLLGSGGFGDVYLVKKDALVADGDTREHAMKTELTTGDKRLLRLKIELTVLQMCGKFKPDEGKVTHFVPYIDRGIVPKFKFVVMGLVGPSLEDVRRQYLAKNFSKSTAMQVSIQTLQALKDLHSLGWLHRDIKPANYAVGLGDNENIIYLLDFGIARRFLKPDNGNVKIPRAKVKFLGTLRFASRACHQCVEQARKDDLETWLYMVYDLFDDEFGLPWKKAFKKNLVVQEKEKFFTCQVPKTVYRFVPAEMKRIVIQVGNMTYYEAPAYDAISNTMVEIAKNDKIDLSKKLDWMGQLKKKKDATIRKKNITVSVSEEEPDEPEKPVEKPKKLAEKETEEKVQKIELKQIIAKVADVEKKVDESTKESNKESGKESSTKEKESEKEKTSENETKDNQEPASDGPQIHEPIAAEPGQAPADGMDPTVWDTPDDETEQ